MLPIIICDDQIEHRNYIKELVEKYILIEELDMKIMLSVGNPQAVIKRRFLLRYNPGAKNPYV